MAQGMARIYSRGNVETQWPVSSLYLSPAIVETFIRDFHNYSEELAGLEISELYARKAFPTRLSQILIMLIDRTSLRQLSSEEWKKTFFNLSDAISVSRVDPVLESSISLKKPMTEIRNPAHLEAAQARQLLAFCDSMNEISHPIYRGFGYEIFEENGKIMRYYYDLKNCPFDRILISEEVSSKPLMDFFGRVHEVEKIVSASAMFMKGGETVDVSFEESKKLLSESIMKVYKKKEGPEFALNSIADDFSFKKSKIPSPVTLDYPPKSNRPLPTEEELCKGLSASLRRNLNA